MKALRNRIVGAVACAALAVAQVEPVYAQSLANQMDTMFGTLTSVTPPGGVETLRRGGLYGGRLRVRNRTMTAQIVQFTPPSFRAGCGGVDFFGGSFSFINLDQFTQLLRSIASAALGYAFMLALKNVCEVCATVLAQLQRAIQMLNQLNANSCQLAQGLVNDTLKAMDFQNVRGMSTHSIREGITDAFDAFWGAVSNVEVQVSAATRENLIQGNLGWQALQDAGVSGWFLTGGTGNQMLHAILTVTGTVVIGDLGPDGRIVVVSGTPEPAGQNHQLTIIEGYTGLTLRDVIFGNDSVVIKRCIDETARCDDGFVEDTVDIEGFVERLDAQMYGTGGTPGILDKLVSEPQNITAADRTFLEVTMKWSQLAGMLYELARLSPGNSTAPHTLYEDAKVLIALELAKGIFDEFFTAIDQALSSDYVSQSPYQAQIRDVIERSRAKVNSDLQILFEQAPDQGQVVSRFLELRQYIATIQQVRLD